MIGDSWLSIAVFSLFGFLAVAFVGQRTNTLAPTIVGYLLRWVLGVVVVSSFGLLAPDAIYYDSVGQLAAEGGSLDGVTAGKEGWPTILAALYSVFGHVPTLGLIVNVTLGALTVPIAGEIAHLLGLPRRTTAWIAALLPSSVMWSSLLLREALAWFFLLLFVCAAAKLLFERISVLYLVVAVVALVGLFSSRGSLAIIIGAGAILAFVLTRQMGGKWGVLVAVGVAVASGPLSGRIDQILGGYSLAQIDASREALARSGESAFEVAQLSDPIGVITSLPTLLSRILAGPFIWEWPGMSVLLVFESIVWMLLLILTIRGWLRAPSKRRLLILIIPLCLLILVLAITSGNYGTMMRLRVQAELLMIPVAALGLSRVNREERWHRGRHSIQGTGYLATRN